MVLGVICCLLCAFLAIFMWVAFFTGYALVGVVLMVLALIFGAIGSKRIKTARTLHIAPVRKKTSVFTRVALIIIFFMLLAAVLVMGTSSGYFPPALIPFVLIFGFGAVYNIICIIKDSSLQGSYASVQPAPVPTYNAEALKIIFRGMVPQQLTPDLISRAADTYERDQIRILNDGYSLINKTCNPDTFFFRLGNVEEILNEGARLEALGPYLKQFTPTAQYNSFLSQKCAIIDSFIDRSFNDTMSRAQSLKTQSAKEKRTEKYFASVKKYQRHMFPQNIQHINELEKINAPDFSVET